MSNSISTTANRESSFGRIVENIVRQINDHVVSCFGPKSTGNSKIITIINKSGGGGADQPQQQQYLSNEGGFIIQNLYIKHPVGLIIVKLVRQIQIGCGDGTISVICLLNSLLKAAQDLINNDSIETNLVCETFGLICKKCVDEMKKFAFNILVDDNGNCFDLSSVNNRSNNKDILNVKIHIDKDKSGQLVRTYLGTKLNDEKIISQLVNVCLEASLHLYDGLSIKQMKNIQMIPNFHNINIISQTSLSSRVEYFDGIAFEHQRIQNQFMPRSIKNKCRVIAISDMPLEILKEKKKNEFKTAQERLDLLRRERQVIDQKLQKIIDFSPNLVISNCAIDDTSLNILSQRHKIIALSHIRQDIFDRICEVTNSTKILDCEFIREECIGQAESIEVKEGQLVESTIYIKTKKSSVGTIIVSASNRILNQLYSRLIRGALKVLRNSYEDCLIAPGGGSLEMMLSYYLKKESKKLESTTEQMIYEKFSNALQCSIPLLICERSGLNTSTALRMWTSQLKKEKISTIDMDIFQYAATTATTAQFIHPESKGVWDSMRVKIQCLHQAVETACTLLKIDSVHTTTDTRQEFNENMQKTLTELSLQGSPPENDDDWMNQNRKPFTRIPSHTSSTQNERRKQRIIRKDQAFYSKEKSKQRKKLDQIQQQNNLPQQQVL